MNKKWIKVVAPIALLVVGVGGMNVIGASGKKEEEKKAVDTRPTVQIREVNSLNHQVIITGYGEVKPLETTELSAQVSGEVVKWHPNFVAGGLVKRGDVLFEIEKDAYQAAFLQAEAQLSQAKANLIEEQGRADVAKSEAQSMPDAKVTDLYLRKPQLMTAKAQVKSAQAALRLAQRDLNNCTVVAPYNALVISRNLGVGQFVSTGAKVAQIHNIEVAEVVFPIAGFDSAFLPETLLGLDANVATEGRYTMSRSGTIVRDLGVIDTDTRMSNVVVRIEDPYSINSDLPKLRFGHYVTVTFNGQTLNNVFRLSQDLVTNNSVWIVGEENKLDKKDVEVLREEGEFFILGNGLSEADKVVLTLPEYPQKGMEIKIAGLKDVASSETDNTELAIAAPAVANEE
ncbi:MAG: efflux RND transporter periplasmic adaptor subunit [Gammaproteobacteria bacterium]|nr:efflux RND transporter periplasmic adaptor subunit [Gammaproteobacteria bacterium]